MLKWGRGNTQSTSPGPADLGLQCSIEVPYEAIQHAPGGDPGIGLALLRASAAGSSPGFGPLHQLHLGGDLPATRAEEGHYLFYFIQVEGEGIANATSGSRGSSFSSAHIGGKREHWLLFILFYGGGPGLSSERKEQPWGGTLTVALMLVGKKPGMLSSSLACSTQKA
ncbi:unnamed protein product [Eretmochelys imbricata]